MKIRTLFLFCTATMMTVSVAATGVIVSGAWRSYEEALRADALALTTKTLLHPARHIDDPLPWNWTQHQPRPIAA